MRSLIAILATVFLATATFAQPGQVVQLPSISTFSYSGSVVVPDGGTALLGSNRSSASGVSRRGGIGNSFGSSQSAAQATVKATILDLDAMDRQILGKAAQPHPRARDDSAAATRSLDPDRDGKALVRYARTLHREGRSAASFSAYRTAIGILSPRLSDLAAAEFRRVFGSAADQAMRMSAVRR